MYEKRLAFGILMHLSVTCPRCESKYQLDPSMRGKRMRCPNTICQAVFEVRDDNDPPPAPVPPPVAERAPEPPPAVAERVPEPPAAPPKPPARKPIEAKKPESIRKPVPKPVEPVPDFPEDFPGDDELATAPATAAVATEAWQPEAWESPPVREEAAPTPAPFSMLSEPAPRRRSRALWLIGGMVLVLGLVAGGAYWRIRGTFQSKEAERFQQAENLYKDQQFVEAAAALQKLHRDFPDSASNKKYRFLAELSDVRGAAYGAQETPEEISKSVHRVLELTVVYKGDSLLKEREADLGQTLFFLARRLTELAERDKAVALLPNARRAFETARKMGATPGERERKLPEEWTRIEKLLAEHAERQQVVAFLKKQIESASAPGVKDAWAMIEKTKRQEDAELRTLLAELQKAHKTSVRFVPASPDEKGRPLDEDSLASLSVTPSVRLERTVKTNDASILALARGVLYALDPAKGDLRWVRRVGIDTHVLPLRLPADATTPELVLALSSDQRSLAALVAATGETLWQTPLDGACVGSPLVIEHAALVPTISGRIEEIELSEGRRLGAYHVGQPLLLPGAFHSGSGLAYFPADELCLYEIDVKKRLCTNILYTRHPPGSLRGAPALVTEEKNSWLLWCEATGLDHAAVKPYALPIQEANQPAGTPSVELKGLSAPPWFGMDRWAALKRGGLLVPFGIRQKGMRDPLFFPLLQQEYTVDATKSGRAEIVFADAENYWTLIAGRLQRVQAVFHPDRGPELHRTWPQPVSVGRLLHAAQVRHESEGRLVLFLTTQSDDEPVCVASAIEAESGKVLWQRQLGTAPQQAPFSIAGQIFLADPNGVLRLSPKSTTEPQWTQAGSWALRSSTPKAKRTLLADEKTLVQLFCPPGATKLHVQMRPIEDDAKSRDFDVALPATIQGAPVLGDGYVLVPLANGILGRVALNDGAYTDGPDWRVAGAEEQALGHVTFLGPKEIVLTDGSRGLSRFVMTDNKLWEKRASLQLSHRILAQTVIPGADKARLAVLDANDTVTLAEPDRLTVLRRWNLGGKVTAGPFGRAGKIGCVVGRNRLVWVDPNQNAPIWEYAFAADIVGEPQVIDGTLVVADVAGQFLALDPASGRPVGTGFMLKANVAPVAAPQAFGEGRAFAPLTDGTIIIVPLEKLRQ